MFLRESTQNTRESIMQWIKDATSSSCVQLLVYLLGRASSSRRFFFIIYMLNFFFFFLSESLFISHLQVLHFTRNIDQNYT